MFGGLRARSLRGKKNSSTVNRKVENWIYPRRHTVESLELCVSAWGPRPAPYPPARERGPKGGGGKRAVCTVLQDGRAGATLQGSQDTGERYHVNQQIWKRVSLDPGTTSNTEGTPRVYNNKPTFHASHSVQPHILRARKDREGTRTVRDDGPCRE